MTAVGNLGKWDRWYRGLTDPQPYGDDTTYREGADFLAPCRLVEDWGCGKGWMSQFVPPERYRGIDGSATPFAAEVADLATYRSEVPGIFMRHVLEHDHRWADILEGAVASFTERLCVVLFTPLAAATAQIAWNEDPGVPDISFHLPDLLAIITGAEVTHETMATATQYGTETVICATRVT